MLLKFNNFNQKIIDLIHHKSNKAILPMILIKLRKIKHIFQKKFNPRMLRKWVLEEVG